MKTFTCSCLLTLITLTAWAQQQEFLSDSLAQNDRFGNAVAVSRDGEVMVVGASHDDEGGINRGAVFVYLKADDNTWAMVDKLTPMNPQDGDQFGISVDVSRNGERIAVGLRIWRRQCQQYRLGPRLFPCESGQLVGTVQTNITQSTG